MSGQGANATQKRLRILSDEEIEALYGRPHFTPEEQQQYFTLAPAEKELVQEFRSVPSQVYFMLQLGYFKAKALFFNFAFAEVKDDLQSLLAHYFPQTSIDELRPLNKRTNLRQRHLILTLCGYHSCGAAER